MIKVYLNSMGTILSTDNPMFEHNESIEEKIHAKPIFLEGRPMLNDVIMLVKWSEHFGFTDDEEDAFENDEFYSKFITEIQLMPDGMRVFLSDEVVEGGGILLVPNEVSIGKNNKTK